MAVFLAISYYIFLIFLLACLSIVFHFWRWRKKPLNFPWPSRFSGIISLSVAMKSFLHDFCGCPIFLGPCIQAPVSWEGSRLFLAQIIFPTVSPGVVSDIKTDFLNVFSFFFDFCHFDPEYPSYG